MNHLSSFFPDPKGARLHYQYWEDSSKGYDKVALLLHGLGYHSGSYPALVPAFVGARYKVVAPDFAGFGASPGERGAGGTLAMADAIETLCRRIEAAEGTQGDLHRRPFHGRRRGPLVPQALSRAPNQIRRGLPSPLRSACRRFARSSRRGRGAQKKIAEDPRYAASMPNSLAADLDRTAKELLARSLLPGRT